MDTREWDVLIAVLTVLFSLLTIQMILGELSINKRTRKKSRELILEEERKKYHD